MRRLVIALAILVVLGVHVAYALNYIMFEKVAVGSVAIGMTISSLSASGGHPQANSGVCRASVAEMRYTIDGRTPTTTIGTLLEVGDLLAMAGNDVLLNFRAIATGATAGQLDCNYWNP